MKPCCCVEHGHHFVVHKGARRCFHCGYYEEELQMSCEHCADAYLEGWQDAAAKFGAVVGAARAHILTHEAGTYLALDAAVRALDEGANQ